MKQLACDAAPIECVGDSFLEVSASCEESSRVLRVGLASRVLVNLQRERSSPLRSDCQEARPQIADSTEWGGG